MNKELLEQPEVAQLMLTAMQRVRGRMDAGEGMPDRSVPDDKAAFPKMLCLDQMKWIDLARAHYGRPQGAPFADALSAVRSAVEKGRLRVPMVMTNLVETSETRNSSQRERLAAFMVDLSTNSRIVNPDDIQRWELRHALETRFLRHNCTSTVRSRMVRWGLCTLSRQQVHDNELAYQAIHEPELTILAIKNSTDDDTVQATRRLDVRAMNIMEDARRAGLHEDVRRQLEVTSQFVSGGLADRLQAEARELGILQDQLDVWLQANRLSFARAVPSMRIRDTILLARDRSADHKTHANDLKDLAFLACAVPYANVVITEKLWSHLATSEGLGEHYDTTIESDARRLPELLRAAGCL